MYMYARLPNLVGMAFPVLEILLLSNLATFPFWTIEYMYNSPWSSKNLIDRNRLKKFMQVGIDVKYMHTHFGGHGLFGFGDMATFQKQPNFPFGAWTIVHGHRKFNQSESAQKIHASRGRCHVHMHQILWVWFLWFQRYGYLSKTAKFPFWGMDYSPWSSKNLIDRNRLKKLMQVGVDVTCMCTRFGGCGFIGFGDMATFQK